MVNVMQLLGEKEYSMNDGEEKSRSRNERGSGSDGQEGRPGASEGIDEGAPEGNRDHGGEEALGGSGCVYFIETNDGAFVKIGYSIDVPRRFDEIGVLLPGLRLIGHMPGARMTETWLHRKFKGSRERGEWFRSSEELRALISALGPPEPEAEPEPAKAITVAKQDGSGNSIGAQMVARRYAKMTPEARSAAAKNAAVKKWAAVKAKKKAAK
jgi:hypothetical protein